MKRWIVYVVVVAICVGLFAIAKRHVEARMSWYYLGGQLDGRNILVTCLSGDPILVLYGGASPNERVRVPPLAGLEVQLACKAADRYKNQLVADTSGMYGENRNLNDLVRKYNWCGNPKFSKDQYELCTRTSFDAIDWMIENGAPINPPDSCGYLHTAAHQMNEDMFGFLLSRGASPEQLCPPQSAEFGLGVDRLIDTKSKTVDEMLTTLLSEYTEVEKATIVSGWVRMLNTIKAAKE